jgi:plastocyanin
MINAATKFVLGLAAAAVVAFVGATLANDDMASALLFVGLALAAGGVAIGVGRSIGADLPPTGDAGASTPIDPTDVPRGSYGPITTAGGAFVLTLGGALGPRYLIAGIVVAVVGVTVWVFDSLRPEIDPRDAKNVDDRLLGPLALPVFAFILAITIAYSFSRVLLAVNETASWVIAFIVAAVLLVILFVIASQRPSTKIVGERDFHRHEHEVPAVEITAKDTAFDRNVIGLPADTDVELIFTNFDVDIFHNVAIYTADEPGEPIYNGKPIAKGKAVYAFKAPDAGTYRYVCDFHPTMVGELRLTPSAVDSSAEHTAEETH